MGQTSNNQRPEEGKIPEEVGNLFEQVPNEAAKYLLDFAHSHKDDLKALEIEISNFIGATSWAYDSHMWTLLLEYIKALDELLAR
jgi:hypothetical protein